MNVNKIIEEAVYTQFNLFDEEPEVIVSKKRRPKMSDQEKAERKAKRDAEKRIAADKEFERKWAEKGVFQAQIFDDDQEVDPVKKAVKEAVEMVLSEESGIHIKPENKGKFTATKEKTGKSTSELLNSPNKKTRSRANFARMAKRGWKPLKK